MNRKVQMLFLSLAIITAAFWTPATQAMRTGILQFSGVVKKTPALRIYFAGSIIDCNTNHAAKQATFNIPCFERNRPLYLLVTEHVRWHAEENTIKYLKTAKESPYKLYLMTPQANRDVYWDIQEVALNSEGQIPDNTVIVVFNPNLIEAVEGGNSITLPTLRVYDDILDRVGTEEQLHAMAEELLLASIDSDSIHVKTHCTVKPYYRLKTVVALTT